MGNHVFRRLALYGGAVALGSVVVDLLRFTPWKDNHDIKLPLFILAGLAITYSIRYVTESILRRGNDIQ